jgi:GMP synthase (glutamine-hydrolysing)
LPKLLTLIHAPWERPHRILAAFGEVEVVEVEALDGDPLPLHEEVDGVIAMGGPMNVDDLARFPSLAAEREWLAEAVRRQMPVLGICLGAQLVARALGAEVRAGERPEIGFAAVRIQEPADPVVGPLAPSCAALHWHGDVFDLPPGAVPVASSAQTELQAFRSGAAWGVLFHPEADSRLIEDWLAVPSMLAEATAALGPDAAETLRTQAREHEAELIERSAAGFRAFADLLAR